MCAVLVEPGRGRRCIRMMHHLTRDSFNFKINCTHDGAYASCDYRANVMLVPPYSSPLLPSPHAPTKLNPKNLPLSPSKITTHFGSHSNHSIPHHIQKPSPTPSFARSLSLSATPSTCPASEQQKYPEMYSRDWLFSVREEMNYGKCSHHRRRIRQTALWWCFAFHPSLRSQLNFLRLLPPHPRNPPLYHESSPPSKCFLCTEYSYYC